MSNLYGDLSQVYEAMYQTFINYEEEYLYYSELLKRYQCNTVLEIGCGTGHLAHHFSKDKIGYIGIDLSEAMLAMARVKNPTLPFLMADMRLFKLDQKVESTIITGRTISYLITNNDVYHSFSSIHSNMIDEGILIFDCIDASKFIPIIKHGRKVKHAASFNGSSYQRLSHWKINLAGNWLFDWHSTYEILSTDGLWAEIGTDDSTIRTFTKEDIIVFLDICGFEVNEIYARDSYAFDTFVVIAKKKQGKN